MAVEWIVPNGVGSKTQMYHQKPSSGQHWDKVDDPAPATPDNTTWVYSKHTPPGDPPNPNIE